MKANILFPIGVALSLAQFSIGAPNPIIFIPGTVGSRLVDLDSGYVVWGEFSRKAANGKTDLALRGMAHPMKLDHDLSSMKDSVCSDGVLDIVPFTLLPGIKVNSPYYDLVIKSLRATATLKHEADETPPCYVFDYDWRRSGDENAAKLADFIRGKSVEMAARNSADQKRNRPIKFDLVTHSHAALITRYYLMHGDQMLNSDGTLPTVTWAGANKVSRVIMLGPPHAGIPKVLRHLTHGYKEHPALPFYDAAVVGTLPSIYQMLPRVRHNCLIDPETRETVDHFDPDLWIENEWGLANPRMDRTLARILPGVTSRESRREIALDHLRKCLHRANQFQEAVDRPTAVPKDLEFVCIGSNAEYTDYQYLAKPRRVRIHSKSMGDGTVPLYSTKFFCARLPKHPHLEEPYRGRRQLLPANHDELATNPEVVDLLMANLW